MVHPSVKVEDPRISRPATPQVDDSPLPKVRVEDPKKPISEAPTSQVEPPTSGVEPPGILKPLTEETALPEQEKLPEAAEMVGLKDLRI